MGNTTILSHFHVSQKILSIETILLKSLPESCYEPSIQSLTCIVKIATISLQLSSTTFDFPSHPCPKIDCTKLQLAQCSISQENKLNLKKIVIICNILQFKLHYYKGYNPMTLFSTNQMQISPLNQTSRHTTRGNYNQLTKLLIVKQILLVNNQGNVWRAVWRICILTLGCKGLTFNFQHLLLEQSFNSKKRINFFVPMSFTKSSNDLHMLQFKQ